MQREQTGFYSDGTPLVGTIYRPEPDTTASGVLVVACSGFMGLNNIHPERFARSLTRRGHTCFGFDYRGFGPSGGTPGRVLLEEQVRDIRHAASFASSQPGLQQATLVLLGWGMGGGLILQAARGLSRVRGLVCVNGFYDAQRVQRAVRSEQDWQRFQSWVQQQRSAMVRSSELLMCDPFHIYPLDPVTREYVDNVLRKNPDFGGQVYQGLADSLLAFAPEAHLEPLAELPLLVAHGETNALHPPQEARSLFERYPGPKELYWVEGGGHTEWMLDEHPLYQALAARIGDWIEGL